MVSSLVKDQTREEMYWLAEEGRLRGIVAGLGHEPHSFLALAQAETGELMPHDGGLETDISLYFNDGPGCHLLHKIGFLKPQFMYVCMYVCMYVLHVFGDILFVVYTHSFLVQHAVHRACLFCRMYG